MRRFNLKALLVFGLGHLTADLCQGALPAVLPFLNEDLTLAHTTAGGAADTRASASTALRSVVVLPVAAFFLSMALRYFPERQAV